jgi:Glycosyltransferase 61
MKSLFGFGPRKPPPEPATPPAAPAPAEGSNAWAALRAGVPVPPRSPEPPPARVQAPPPPVHAAAAAPPPPPRAPLPAPPPPKPEPSRRFRPLASAGNLRTVGPHPVADAGRQVVENFAETIDLEELGRLTGPHRLRLAPEMQCAPPAPLFRAASLPERIRDHHAARPSAPPADILALPGYELGGAGLLQRDGSVFADPATMPEYVTALVKPEHTELPPMWAGSLLKPDADVVETDVPVAVAFHPNLVYGHFLLEMLPRLGLLARLRGYGRAFPIAVPTDWPPWAHDFVKLFYDPAEIIWYHKEQQRLRAPCFLLPTMLHTSYNFHPLMNDVAQTTLALALEPASTATPPRLYLSRSRHPPGLHGILNELEVEDTLVRLGFTIIHPQELPFPKQMALYAGATCLVSAFGSATHNSLFAPRGAKVFCLNWRNELQSRICNLRGQPVGYFQPEEGYGDPPDHAAVSVNCAELAQQVTEFERMEWAGEGAR